MLSFQEVPGNTHLQLGTFLNVASWSWARQTQNKDKENKTKQNERENFKKSTLLQHLYMNIFLDQHKPTLF